jgi:hypothetical protein
MNTYDMIHDTNNHDSWLTGSFLKPSVVPVCVMCPCSSCVRVRPVPPLCVCVCLLRMCVSVSRHTVVAVDEVSEAVESGARVSPL